MKTKVSVSKLLLICLFVSQLCMTVRAAEDDIILISPRPTAEENTSTAGIDALLRSQYEKNAGMYAYDGIASRLYDIGVLRGDGENFKLDEMPDRQQACVMVVRMRGEEAAALAAYEAGEITCPFTDVTDEWVKPYLAWLYEKQITLGIGGGKFGNDDCTAQDYVTFMLRALGYTVAWDQNADGSDVFYADVLDFARGLDLWDERLACELSFHRGVMSAVTYQTLAADVKGTDARLLSVLTETGAVDAEKAQPILELYDKIDAAAALEAAAISLIDGGIRMTGKMVQDEYHVRSVTHASGERTEDTASGSLTLDIGLDLSAETQVALDGELHIKTDDTDAVIPMGIWLCDGVVYIDMMDWRLQAEAAAMDGFPALTSVFGDLTLLFEDVGYPYYAVSDVFIETLDGTAIIYDTTDFMWPMAAVQTNTDGFSESAVMTALVSVQKMIGEDGVPVSVSNRMYTQISGTNMQSGTADSSETLLENTVTYTAWGDDVELCFPDFSLFEVISDEIPDDAAESNL